MSIADTAAALGAAHTDATSQKAHITKMIKQAERAQARLRDAATGAANPLAERAVGSYADAIGKLREGAALLAEVTGILSEYARTAAIDLPAGNIRHLPINRSNAQPHKDTADKARPTGTPDEGNEPEPGQPET